MDGDLPLLQLPSSAEVAAHAEATPSMVQDGCNLVASTVPMGQLEVLTPTIAMVVEGAATSSLPPAVQPVVRSRSLEDAIPTEATVVEGAATSSLPPPVVQPMVGSRLQPVMTPRRSERHLTTADGASAMDEDALAKAMRRKAAMYTPPIGTSLANKSFLSYSNSKISSKLRNVGVCLGRNENEITVSANMLKHMEYDR